MNKPDFSEKSKCLAKKHLSSKIFQLLKSKKSNSGFTLLQAINSGIKNIDSSIGIYAGDAMCYQTFALIFNPVIQEYHSFLKNQKHKSDMKLIHLSNIDPEKKYIQSTRIRVARNLKSFDFPPQINLSNRRELEKLIVSALKTLKGTFKGVYYSFTDNAIKQDIDQKKLWFPKGDRFQDAAGINSDFPECRGIFQSINRQFMVWVNEEDHLRIIGIKQSADIAKVYNNVCKGIHQLSKKLEFSYHDTYGYLTSCPTNIGTSMRAGVHIKLEKLAKRQNILKDIVNSYKLQIRGTNGEKSKVQNSVFDISNRQRLGISEYEIIHNLYKGIQTVIKHEKTLKL